MAVRFGEYTFDGVQRRLTRQGAPVHLTPLAFTLLDRLIASAPRVSTKEELHRLLWPDTFVSDASLTSLIKELRRALDDRDARAIIRTVNRVGYAFGGALEPLAATTSIHWVEVHDRRVRLHGGDNVIGRAPDADVVIDAANISRRHAAIVVTEGVAELRDLGSKNGTRVNDRLLDGPLAMRDGDRISLGRVTLVYRRAESGPSTETQVNSSSSSSMRAN